MGVLGAAQDGRKDWSDLTLSYDTVQPNKWTFQSDKIRRWVEERLRGRVLNACAGKTKLVHDGEAVVAGQDAVTKRQFDKLLAPGGRVIQFGFTTTCMPTSLGYERDEVEPEVRYSDDLVHWDIETDEYHLSILPEVLEDD